MLLSDCVPQVCFTEHHLKEEEINITRINCYNLGASYCKKTRKFGGVGIFVHNTLPCTPIDLNEYCNEQDLEACALKFKSLTRCFVYCAYTDHQQETLELLCIYLNLYSTNYTQTPLM
jgi:hypothetical protein